MVDLLKLFGALCLLAVVSSQSAPIVSTTLGSVRGSILKTEKNSDIYAFRGIRYAQAPVGDLRFKAPVAVTKWETELDATKDGFMCPQSGKSAELISEDCLILNVYSRDLTGNQTVIVYIHGGANIFGSSHSELDTGPEYLMDSSKPVVVVTFNYRLGAFGFLTTRTADAPGNFGYLDQNMALQWVRDHISNFGGNQESVTILGQSAGSMAVTLHMSSPLSKGLFHRAIAMSGSATNHHAIDNLYWTTQLARHTSCPLYNPPDLVSCLRKLPWQTLISDSWMTYIFLEMNWNFEIDGHFLEDHPTNIFAQGKFNKVPLLAGITKDEFAYMVYLQEGNTGLFNDIYLNFDRYGPELFAYSPNVNGYELKSFYLGNQTINDQDLANFGLISSDASITHGVHRLVELARKYVDVYYYRFDYAGRFGIISDADGKPRGVGHSDDLQYVIKQTDTNQHIGLQDPEWFMVERLVGWFSTFAQTSSPGEPKWLPSNKEIVRTLYNDKEVRLGDEPYQERFELWDTLFPIARSGSSSTIYAAGLLTGTAAVLSVLSSKYTL